MLATPAHVPAKDAGKCVALAFTPSIDRGIMLEEVKVSLILFYCLLLCGDCLRGAVRNRIVARLVPRLVYLSHPKQRVEGTSGHLSYSDVDWRKMSYACGTGCVEIIPNKYRYIMCGSLFSSFVLF